MEYREPSDLKKLENNPQTIKKADLNRIISKNYSTRSMIPELAIKEFFEQAIEYIKSGSGDA